MNELGGDGRRKIILNSKFQILAYFYLIEYWLIYSLLCRKTDYYLTHPSFSKQKNWTKRHMGGLSLT